MDMKFSVIEVIQILFHAFEVAGVLYLLTVASDFSTALDLANTNISSDSVLLGTAMTNIQWLTECLSANGCPVNGNPEVIDTIQADIQELADDNTAQTNLISGLTSEL